MATAVNDVTGKVMKTGITTEAFRSNFDKAFGKRIPQLNVDMDGVLADFDKLFIERHGVHPKTLSEEEFWNRVIPFPNWFAELAPMEDAFVLVRGVNEWVEAKYYEPHILTALPKKGRLPLSEDHKRDWLPATFNELVGGWTFKTGPYREGKKHHCQPGDILIDDREDNVEEWTAAGGFGILHTSAAESLKVLWNLPI